MKKLTLVICLLLGGGHIIAQNCVRNIRTKWDSAYNTELNSFSPLTNPWINTFNIGRNNGAAFYSIPIDPNAGWHPSVPPFMPTPFVAGPSEYSYLYQPSLGSVHDKDYHWEDGWEVQWLNLGYYPNGEKIDSLNIHRIVPGPDAPANNRVPYIIIYNRYTGKLRIFANLVTGFNSYHNARMIIKHPSLIEASGIFRHMDNYDRSLDQPTKIWTAASANMSNLNNNNVWMSTDFQLGYDPCVCVYPSNIEYRISTVKHYNVNLLGRSISTTFPVSAIDSPAYSNFLTNEGLKEGFNSGSVLYKSISQMLDDYDAELGAYNTRMNSYNSFFNSNMRQLITSTHDALINAAGPFNPKPIGDIILRQLVRLDGAQSYDSTISSSWANEVNKTTKGQMAKSFDFLSVAGFGKDFFQAPMRPSMPTATFSEMRIAGTIDDSAEVFVVNWLTPGSYKYPQVPTAFNYPAYNEAPGLFALLRSPKVKIYKERTFTYLDGPPTTIWVAGIPVTFFNGIRNKVYLKLSDPLKYRLNPALDFDTENTKLYVSFVVELENQERSIDNDTTFKPNKFQVNTDKFYLMDAFPPDATRGDKVIYGSRWMPMEDAGEILFDLDFTDSIDRNSNPLTARFMGDFAIKKVTLKIAADMYFNQIGTNGLQNSNFQSFTYLLFDDDEDVNLLTETTDPSEVLRYKYKNLVIIDDTIQPTDSFVFETIGNTIFVNAETIELKGNISVQSGYQAELQATKSVKGISRTTTLGRNIHLKKVNGFSPFGKITETPQSEVDAFCLNQSDGYKANTASAKWDEDEPDTQEPEPTPPKTIVYPNPAANQFNVQISLDEEKEYNFVVYDLMGRSLIDETVRGANQPQFEITTEKLSAGTYFLTIKTIDGALNETHRVVIIK